MAKIRNKGLVKKTILGRLMIALAVAVLVLVGVIANRVSSNKPVSPNAPESQAEAKGKNNNEDCGKNKVFVSGKCRYKDQVENNSKYSEVLESKKTPEQRALDLQKKNCESMVHFVWDNGHCRMKLVTYKKSKCYVKADDCYQDFWVEDESGMEYGFVSDSCLINCNGKMTPANSTCGCP